MSNRRGTLQIRRDARAGAGLFDELLVDNFAGGGGASLGIEHALGRSVDLAINHDLHAVRMHAINHPHTRHLREDVWAVDPVQETAGRPVGLAWFSPDCKHFSRAKGGRPVNKKIRGLAWVVMRWARAVRPRIIMLENVREFEDWGPLQILRDDMGLPVLDRHGEPVRVPDATRKGRTFRRFVSTLRNLGYAVEWRSLNAADYGAPTHRRRLFLVARCDGEPIIWPEPTHGPGRKPYRTAAECIDWTIPCPSIFLSREQARQLRKKTGIECKRPLAEKTMRRIALGLKRYVLDNPKPFIVRADHGGDEFRGQPLEQPLSTITGAHGYGVVSPCLAKICQNGSEGSRTSPVSEPLRTVVSKNEDVLVAAHLTKYHGQKGNESCAKSMNDPLPTADTSNRFGVVYAFLAKYFSTAIGQPASEPLHTITGHDRFGVVTVRVGGQPYVVTDIGMRMLTPRELLRAQFGPELAERYVLTGSKAQQVRMIGNSVAPAVAAALVQANMAYAEAAVVA